MAEPTEDERDHIAGCMHARLSSGYAAEVYPQVEGLRPIPRAGAPTAPGLMAGHLAAGPGRNARGRGAGRRAMSCT